MDSTTIQRDTRPSTPEPAYVLRGLGLYELHADEILASYRGAGRYVVPSGTDTSGLYEVRVGTRLERNTCECRGWSAHRHCSHLIAAERVAKRSAVCDSCGERRWDRELVEVTEDHDSLTWFPGDLLCRCCVRAHGGIS
ncbi:MAG: hypothetical protein M3Q60_18515 [Actinomycetota bacterium]|nr:hypothetical protein [Actinomycetota bacterium]